MAAKTNTNHALNRRHTLLVLGVVVVFGTVISWAQAWSLSSSGIKWIRPEQAIATPASAREVTAQTPARRTLDGLPVSEGSINPVPVAVMIENLPVVRPQAGLAAASVVYETLAEGGATRFLAVFSGPGDHLERIGPVRSARPYYLEWNDEYDGVYAHAGGSPEALSMISAFSIRSLNGIAGAGKYFWRDRSRSAPHNLFTSSDNLTKALRDLNLTEGAPTFQPWTFKDDRPVADRPGGEPFVRMKFSGFAFETEYRYRRDTNTYARFNASEPHTDELTGEQIQVKNVIVQFVPPIVSVGEKGRLTLNVTGSGKALIFVDGGVNVGTWTKNNRNARTQFFYEDGREAEFSPGSTWVHVIPDDRTVEYGTR